MVFRVPKSVTLRSDLCQIIEALIIPAIIHYSNSNASRRRQRYLAIFAVVLCCVCPLQASVAATASEAFEDGNRLFRDDLYWAALLRYRQASEAGMDSPLLHYNTGITHYRAKQHIRAKGSLTKALASPDLRVITHYNLGLNAYAANEIDEALTWFTLARDQNESEKIATLASIAIARIRAQRDSIDRFLVHAEEVRKKREISVFEFHTQVGFGADDNAFQAPDQAYRDFSVRTAPGVLPPVVDPVVQSGAYLPLDLRAKYTINSYEHESFFGAYRVNGRYYMNVELKNANDFSHEASFGSRYKRTQENRTRELFSAFAIAQHRETYYDPDFGVARTSNGELLDDRMNYLRYGPELALRQSYEHLSFGMHIKGELWNYEEIKGTVPEYNHEYYTVGLNVQYKFTRSSLLRISADRYRRRFGERQSYDLDGLIRPGNPRLRYDYLDYGMVARQRIYSKLWFGVGYKRTERTDRYQSYNDYTRQTYSMDVSWKPGSRFSMKLTGDYRLYDFPNALAFNNPIAGRKTLETAQGKLIATYELTPKLSVVAEANFRETASNDTRIQYENKFYVLGIRWQQ